MHISMKKFVNVRAVWAACYSVVLFVCCVRERAKPIDRTDMANGDIDGQNLTSDWEPCHELHSQPSKKKLQPPMGVTKKGGDCLKIRPRGWCAVYSRLGRQSHSRSGKDSVVTVLVHLATRISEIRWRRRDAIAMS